MGILVGGWRADQRGKWNDEIFVFHEIFQKPLIAHIAVDHPEIRVVAAFQERCLVVHHVVQNGDFMTL